MVKKIGVKKLKHTDISLPKDMLDRIDKLAKARSISRGKVLRGLIFQVLGGSE
jgi:metal-responsive CopG/Arc/MetJ family transcriptional regulator